LIGLKNDKLAAIAQSKIDGSHFWMIRVTPRLLYLVGTNIYVWGLRLNDPSDSPLYFQDVISLPAKRWVP
jgi:hypothetical protein